MRTIRDCPVAVVGGAGFLGSHLVDHLVEDRRCKVMVIDNLCVGRREFVHKNALFFHHDITGSEGRMKGLFKKYDIQYVLNYAAWPYIPDSFARPLHVCDVNFMGAIKVINAAQEAGCQAVLQVSSAEIYGGIERPFTREFDKQEMLAYSTDAIKESNPVCPHSSYGAAKAAVDSYCQVAWKERGTPVIALRQFNCVGERETHPYVIPEIIGQIYHRNGEPRTMWPAKVFLGNNSNRDFMYAGDAVRIAVELLERGTFGEVYNLGSQRSVRIYDLAKMVGSLMGVDVNVITDPARQRPWEIWHLQSDNTKIREACGPESMLTQQSQMVTLEDALRKTIKYYEQVGHHWPWEV